MEAAKKLYEDVMTMYDYVVQAIGQRRPKGQESKVICTLYVSERIRTITAIWRLKVIFVGKFL